MKSNIIRYLVFIAIITVFQVGVKPVLAASPALKGRIVAADGTGIKGILVRWKDNQAPICSDPVKNLNGCSRSGTRYAVSSDTGTFWFASWQWIEQTGRNAECSAQVDTDYNGSNDAPKAVNFKGNCDAEGFGCNDNSHIFTPLRRPGWTGRFIPNPGPTDFWVVGDSLVGNIVGQNQATIDIGVFQWVQDTTPTPTAIPTLPPTGTPTPTRIPPTATSIPTATPAPTNPASCNCDYMDLTGTPAPGQNVTFTATGKVADFANNAGQVKDMVYDIGIVDGPQLGNSGFIPPGPPQTEGGNLLYTTTWNYTIPAAGTGQVTYHVHCTINCNRRETYSPQGLSRVLGLQTNKPAFFVSLLRFFTSLLGGNKNTASSSKGMVAGEMIAQSDRTLKLGTFDPTSQIEKGCQDIYFTVNY